MQLTGLGLGLLGDLEEVAKGGVAGVVTATAPSGAEGWGSALGSLGGFGGQGLLGLPPLPVPLPVPGGPLLLPRKHAAAAAALQRALGPRLWEPPFDHIPHGDIVCGARRVLVGLFVLLNPVGAQLFAGPVWPGPDPPALLAEAEGESFHPQPVFHCLRSSKLPGMPPSHWGWLWR